MAARSGGEGGGPRRGTPLLLTARVLAVLGVVVWLVGAASFGEYEEPRPDLWTRMVAGASVGGPVLLGSGVLAVTGLLLQRRR